MSHLLSVTVSSLSLVVTLVLGGDEQTTTGSSLIDSSSPATSPSINGTLREARGLLDTLQGFMSAAQIANSVNKLFNPNPGSGSLISGLIESANNNPNNNNNYNPPAAAAAPQYYPSPGGPQYHVQDTSYSQVYGGAQGSSSPVLGGFPQQQQQQQYYPQEPFPGAQQGQYPVSGSSQYPQSSYPGSSAAQSPLTPAGASSSIHKQGTALPEGSYTVPLSQLLGGGGGGGGGAGSILSQLLGGGGGGGGNNGGNGGGLGSLAAGGLGNLATQFLLGGGSNNNNGGAGTGAAGLNQLLGGGSPGSSGSAAGLSQLLGALGAGGSNRPGFGSSSPVNPGQLLGAGGATNGLLPSSLNELGIFEDLQDLFSIQNMEKLLKNVNTFDSLKCIPRMVCQTIARRQEEAERLEREREDAKKTSTTTRRPKRKISKESKEGSNSKGSSRDGRFLPGWKVQGMDTALEQFVRFLDLMQLKDWSLYPYLQGAYQGHQVRSWTECADRFTTCPFSEEQLLYYFNNYKGGLFQSFRSDKP